MQLFLRWRVTHAGSRTPGTPGKRALAITQQPTSLRAQPKSPPYSLGGVHMVGRHAHWPETRAFLESCLNLHPVLS
jgi:hypothetical protein